MIAPKGLALVAVLTLCACAPTRGDGEQTQSPRVIGMDVHRSVSAPPAPGGSDASNESEGEESESHASGPPAAVVPDVRGLIFASAVRQLWRDGIDVDLVFARDSTEPLWTVIEQHPGPGLDTPASGRVNLVLSLHHVGGAGVIETVACRPELDELRDPYCGGKLLKY
jgi:hypothetical protein